MLPKEMGTWKAAFCVVFTIAVLLGLCPTVLHGGAFVFRTFSLRRATGLHCHKKEPRAPLGLGVLGLWLGGRGVRGGGCRPRQM